MTTGTIALVLWVIVMAVWIRRAAVWLLSTKAVQGSPQIGFGMVRVRADEFRKLTGFVADEVYISPNDHLLMVESLSGVFQTSRDVGGNSQVPKKTIGLAWFIDETVNDGQPVFWNSEAMGERPTRWKVGAGGEYYASWTGL